MTNVYFFCYLKHYGCIDMLAKNVCGLVVSFVVIGGRNWRFQTPNLEVFMGAGTMPMHTSTLESMQIN